MRIALVTGREMAKADPESHLLVAALAEIGIAADVLPWQADCDWGVYPLVVVRTPWDYFRQREAFLAWAERVESLTRLVNPSSVLRWNSHKRYLRELSQQGVPTVPTLWLEQGTTDSERQLDTCSWHEVVVKPAVSIGAIGALRGDPLDHAVRDHVQSLLKEGDVMVQPYVAQVAEEGELSLIYFGGRFSHAVCKKPKAGDYRVQDMYGGTNQLTEAPAAALHVADRALRLTPAPTTYARVDLVCDGEGWLLMEIEVIEPELFLPLAPASSQRFAETLRDIHAGVSC